MNNFTPRHTLIALAIATASLTNQASAMPAMDYNYDFSAGKLISNDQTFANVTLNSSINITEDDQLFHPNAAEIRGAHITGNLTNNATINVSDIASTGLSIGASWTGAQYLGTHIDGNLVNAGNITVSGEYSTGIDFWGETTATEIHNSGSINVSGADSDAVLIDIASLKTLNNSGTIQARGSNANAITIEAGTFTNYLPEQWLDTGIVNSGTILADGVGIDVQQLDAGSALLQINQKAGLISGSVAAIKGGGANLNWSGGKINGDILDIGKVNIIGNATFTGNNIETRSESGFVDIVSGKLSLTNPSTHIAGNFSMAPGSTLELFLDNNTSPSTPLLSISKTAYFDSDSKIQLQANSRDFSTPKTGTEYQLLSAAAISGGENISVASSSALLEVKSFSVAANQVKALVASKSDSVIIDAVLNAGGSQAAAAATIPLTNSVLGNLNASDPVLIAFANANTDTKLAGLAEQLNPVVNGGHNQAIKTNLALVNNAINARSNTMRSGLSSGDLMSENGLWAQALTSDASQNDSHGIAGYDADSNGIAIGADGKLNANTTLGLAYSYLATDINSGNDNKTDVTSNTLTAYGAWSKDNWFVDGSSTYGWNDNKSKRTVASTQAKADYDSEFLGLNALAGYSYQINKNLILEPQVGARYISSNIDSYDEKGSSAALSVDAQRYEIGEIGAGARLMAALELAKGSLEPQASIMAWHDFIGDKVSSTSTFVLGGTPFTTAGADAVRDSYELGLGLDYKLEAWTIGGSYNYLAKTNFNADSFTAKVRYDF